MTASFMGITGQISWQPVFGWWFFALVAFMLVASIWLTFTSKGLTHSQRVTLVSLRVAAILILLLGCLRPGFISKNERETAGAIAVLIDSSESSSFAGEAADRSRWATQQLVWERINNQTGLQLGKTKILPYMFDQTLRSVPQDLAEDSERLFGKPPKGRSTDLGKALSEISRVQIDPPLRGVILMSDGTQTAVPPEVDPTVAANQMAQLDQPIVVVGLGAVSEMNSVKDVAIRNLPERFDAFVNKDLMIDFVVQIQGMQNQPVNVQLELQRDAAKEIVAKRRVLASSPDEQLPLKFRIAVAEAGEYVLTATASTDAKEQTKSNNSAISFISVREGGVRILYLEGQPRFEQKFLTRSLNESLDFDVDYSWFGERFRNNWPIDITDKVDINSYDAFILGDLDAAAIDGATARALARRVGQGAGLLVMGGYHSFDAGGYGRQAALSRVIPLQMTMPRQAFDAPIDRRLHIEEDIELRPTRPHPVTDLNSGEDEARSNAEVWASLRPLLGMNRLGDLSVAPGTGVLLESQNGDPALVTGEYGAGRVLAFAGDTTWRWFMSGDTRLHQKFWRQCLLWLVQRDALQEGFRLSMDTRRIDIDSVPKLTIEWFGGTEGKEMPRNVELSMTRDGKPVQKLTPKVTGKSFQEARLTGLSTAGLHRIELSAVSQDGIQYESDIVFVVRDDSQELMQPIPDWQMLANIVSANQNAGGKLLAPDEIDQAISFFEDRQDSTKVTTLERRQLGDGAWDSWLFLVLFCVAMSIEWGLRKSWQLP